MRFRSRKARDTEKEDERVAPAPSWPAFGAWLAETWVDVVTMVVVAGVAAGVSFPPPSKKTPPLRLT
jgi:hypothetical protein